MTKEKAEVGKTVVVTGSSSGIGFETSLLLAKNGFHTYATVKMLTKLEDFAKYLLTNALFRREHYSLSTLMTRVT
jgi:NAD(P)-dependent dehydrogenase (short-subunit alcohol dehydrogenase family)